MTLWSQRSAHGENSDSKEGRGLVRGDQAANDASACSNSLALSFTGS